VVNDKKKVEGDRKLLGGSRLVYEHKRNGKFSNKGLPAVGFA